MEKNVDSSWNDEEKSPTERVAEVEWARAEDERQVDMYYVHNIHALQHIPATVRDKSVSRDIRTVCRV